MRDDGQLQQLIQAARQRRANTRQVHMFDFQTDLTDTLTQEVTDLLELTYDSVGGGNGTPYTPEAQFRALGYTWVIRRNDASAVTAGQRQWMLFGRLDPKSINRTTPGFDDGDEFLLLLDDLSRSAEERS